jgi:hypothetical protein
MTTFTELTEYIAQQEGLREQVNIAQIKEITKILLLYLAGLPPEQVDHLLGRYKKTG